MKILYLTVLFSLSVNTYSWDGNVLGKVKSIDVTGGTNYGFRISLEIP